MRIVSWNVNGLRAAYRKGFGSWLAQQDADVVAVQEARVHEDQLTPKEAPPAGWRFHLVSGVRRGYSGVALYSRAEPDEVRTSLGEARFDDEGRVQLARFGRLWLANVYFPNGNGKPLPSGRGNDNSRVPYKLAFYRRLFEVLEPWRAAGEPVLVMGDFNTAHRAIDLARPKQNAKTSGFLASERREMTRWMRNGWVDTFRQQHPKVTGAYTWWSQRFGVRARNVGWRIDYVLASPGAAPHVRDAFLWPEVQGSDHCPVGVDYEVTSA